MQNIVCREKTAKNIFPKVYPRDKANTISDQTQYTHLPL